MKLTIEADKPSLIYSGSNQKTIPMSSLYHIIRTTYN